MTSSKPKIFLRSLFISYLISATMLLILSFLLFKLHLSEKQVRIGVQIIYVIACFAGGILCAKSIGKRRLFSGLLSGVIYFLVLLITSFLIHKGINQTLREIAVILSLCLTGGTIGGILS